MEQAYREGTGTLVGFDTVSDDNRETVGKASGTGETADSFVATAPRGASSRRAPTAWSVVGDTRIPRSSRFFGLHHYRNPIATPTPITEGLAAQVWGTW